MMDGRSMGMHTHNWSVRSVRRSMREPGYVDLRKVRTWFAEGEPPAQPPAGTPPPAEPQKPEPKPDAEMPDFVKDPVKAYEEIRKLRDENAKHRTDARDVQARLDKLERERKSAEEQKLTEQQKWEELAKQREAELNEMRAKFEGQILNTLKLEVGNEFKLPKSVAMRLVGKNEDEIRADAEKLAKELKLDVSAETPPPATTSTPPAGTAGTPPPSTPATDPTARRQQTTVVAPGGRPAGETDSQRRARLYKQGAADVPLFKPRE